MNTNELEGNMTQLHDGSTYSSDGPECPYCGFVFTPDDGIYYNESQYTEDQCPECKRKFKVEVNHSTSWLCEAFDSVPTGQGN